MSVFDYHRRKSSPVRIGNVTIGGDNPVCLQSMTNTSTMDTEASVAQAERIASAGAGIVRLTAQGVREARNIGEIRNLMRSHGYETPLVADIHFNPKAAFEAACHTDKVRINPGNFVDPGRTFRKLDYTDGEYAAELERIDEALTPFLELCRKNDVAIRIGVNHGSLSDRIMSRYGDTPAGMVESAMEFLRVCRKRDFDRVVISIKASNVVVMVETARRLVRAMDAEGMDFPLHLGVTEAGDGEDGRVKSAVGIGTLLNEGLGDTRRVSLSEDPECEVPVARKLVEHVAARATAPSLGGEFAAGYDQVTPARRVSVKSGNIGGDNRPVVITDSSENFNPDSTPDYVTGETVGWCRLEAPLTAEELKNVPAGVAVILSTKHKNYVGAMEQALHTMMSAGFDNPVILHADYSDMDADSAILNASVDLGTLLMHGFADGVMITGSALAPERAAHLALGILQSARLRISRTEYIACPGCGRTLFDLQSTLRRVKAATTALRGLKIGVMGCIVNGPGEMADADYGYVGAGAGKVSLYRGKECVEKNIPADAAVERLLALIKADGHDVG